jgi:spermidine/putrescine transport system substrate-binding protein
MKKLLSLALLGAALCALLAGCGGGSGKTEGAASGTLTLNVYNWGEYISDGSDDSYDTVAEFEKWYQETYGQKVKVNYDTYASNEDMYAKLSAGAVSYDVIVPSDYMIARMADEGLLLELNYDNIPNISNIDENFLGLYYDPDGKYAVPYVFGAIGILYDANQVDPADVTGWDLLWNEKYAGSILQFNNPRDAFGTAMYKLGIDPNTTDKAEWDRAYDALMAQRPLRYGLVMDEIFNLMGSGEAAIGVYYTGDYFFMQDAQAEDVDIRYYAPETTNFYIDAMCIPSCCQNKELAECFINFMLERDAAVANALYTCDASPNRIVFTDEAYSEEMGEEAMEILYPDRGEFAKTYNEVAFRNLPQDILDYMSTLWENVKIS